MISSSQRPLHDNTQHSQQTNIHAPGKIWTHNLSRRAAVDLCLRPCGYWNRRLQSYREIKSSWKFAACWQVGSQRCYCKYLCSISCQSAFKYSLTDYRAISGSWLCGSILLNNTDHISCSAYVHYCGLLADPVEIITLEGLEKPWMSKYENNWQQHNTISLKNVCIYIISKVDPCTGTEALYRPYGP